RTRPDRTSPVSPFGRCGRSSPVSSNDICGVARDERIESSQKLLAIAIRLLQDFVLCTLDDQQRAAAQTCGKRFDGAVGNDLVCRSGNDQRRDLDPPDRFRALNVIGSPVEGIKPGGSGAAEKQMRGGLAELQVSI